MKLDDAFLAILCCIVATLASVHSLLQISSVSRPYHIRRYGGGNLIVQSQNDEPSTSPSPAPSPSWQQYNNQYSHQKPHVKQFKKNGIFYKTSLLSVQEFKIIQEELSTLSLNLIKETTSSVAHNRIGAQLPPDCDIIKMLSNPHGSFIQIMNDIINNEDADVDDDDETAMTNMILSPNVPVEMRIYEQRGASMEWHHDDVLYTPEQIEVVFTVENNSDCVTMWEEIDKNGTADQQQVKVKLKQVETEANSAVILRAGLSGARHAVSSLKSGRRVILKFVFVREDAVFLEGAEKHANQFASKKNKNKQGKKKKR